MTQNLPLKRLFIYYAWPIAVNGTWSITQAVNIFNNYHLGVFGKDLENPQHPHHESTKDIINQTSSEIYGEVDCTLSLITIKNKIDQWALMGRLLKKITGIFCNLFGFDYGLARTKQNDIVDYIHSKSLAAFINAWNPDDVFAGLPAPRLNMNDWYLAQSHYILLGDWQSQSEWETKSNKMRLYKQIYNVKMACITTTNLVFGFDQNKWDNAYFAHSLYGFDASGWGEPNYSATDALLPLRNRKLIFGKIINGNNITSNNGTFENKTNVGVYVNTHTKESGIILL